MELHGHQDLCDLGVTVEVIFELSFEVRGLDVDEQINLEKVSGVKETAWAKAGTGRQCGGGTAAWE